MPASDQTPRPQRIRVRRIRIRSPEEGTPKRRSASTERYRYQQATAAPGRRSRRLRQRVSQRASRKKARSKSSGLSPQRIMFMLVVAGVFDISLMVLGILHFVPMFGSILLTIISIPITIVAWLTFFVWFKLSGVHFTRPSQFLALNGGGVAESIPLVKLLPGWTLAVLALTAKKKARKHLPGRKRRGIRRFTARRRRAV